MPLRVGARSHLTLWIPSPRTICMRSARLLRTTTSRTCPVSVTRTLIFSSIMIGDPRYLLGKEQLQSSTSGWIVLPDVASRVEKDGLRLAQTRRTTPMDEDQSPHGHAGDRMRPSECRTHRLGSEVVQQVGGHCKYEREYAQCDARF